MLASSALAGLAVALLWGAASTLESLAAPRNRPLVLVAWDAVWGVIILAGMTLIGINWWDSSKEAWLWMAAGGLFRIVSWVVYWKILADRNSSIAIAISATYSLPAVLMMSALGQPLQWMVLIATLIIFLGVLASGARSKLSPGNLWWALFCCIMWGGWSVCQWKAAAFSPPEQLLGVSWVMNIVPSALIAAAVRIRGESLRISAQTVLCLSAAASIGIISSLVFYWGLGNGDADQVIVLGSVYPLFTLLLRSILRKEKWSHRTALGVLLLSLGAALASIA